MQKRTDLIEQTAPPPVDTVLYRKSPLLAQVIEYGRESNSSDIDAFVFAARQAHHPQAKQFLLDVLHNPHVLHNPLDSDFDPLGDAATESAKGKAKGKWADNQGGSWEEARFHAAIGLAELGVKDGVVWLIDGARANNSGVYGSIFRHPHALDKSGGGLRINCEHALADLTGLTRLLVEAPDSGSPGNPSKPERRRDWDKWWRETAKSFTPRPVTLKP
jgi:hypothetical protein